MPGIEFLPDEPGGAESEEMLESGARRPLPRWLVPLAVAVLAAAAVAVSVSRSDSPTARKPIAVLPSPSRPATSVVVDDRLGQPLDVGGGRPVLDVALSGDLTWVLQAGELHRITGPGGRQTTSSLPGRPLTAGDAGAVARLVLDVPAGRVWIVVEGAAPGRVLEYDLATVHLIRQVHRVGLVSAAAALDGHLYLTVGARLIELPPDQPPRTAARVTGSLGPVVADTARGRLLMSDYGARTRIWSVQPHGPRLPTVAAPVTLKITKASLAVANGAIWLAGFDTGSGILMRLDPRTLRPDHHSGLDPLLEPGAVVVASGVVVIWVRDGGGRQLRCVDAAAGDQLQDWLIDGPVASGGGSALVATPTGAIPLELSSCSG